jgi:hypothetical protein
MGMDLAGEGGYYHFGRIAWDKLLELGRQYGWEPAGTEYPEGTVYRPDGTVDEAMTEEERSVAAGWEGGYLSNNRQWVTAEDAACLADALERALPDIPDFDTDEKMKVYTPDEPPTDPVMAMLAEAGLGDLAGPDDSLSPVEFFSGEMKEKIRGFIRYCRAGGFSIG